jgi:hypothetical protein
MAKKDKKPKSLKDISPFNINSLLVKQAGLTSKYSGGDSYTGYGEIDIDKMMDPMKDLLLGKMNSEEDTGTGGGGDTNVSIGDINVNTPGGTSTGGDDSETKENKKKEEEEGKKKETDPDDPFGCKENPKNDQCPCKCPPKEGPDGGGYTGGTSVDQRDFLGYDSVYIDGKCNCYRDDENGEEEEAKVCECEGPKKGQQIPEGQDSASFCECEEKPVEPEDDDDDDDDDDDGDQTKLCECNGPKQGQRIPIDKSCECEGMLPEDDDDDDDDDDGKKEEKKVEKSIDDIINEESKKAQERGKGTISTFNGGKIINQAVEQYKNSPPPKTAKQIEDYRKKVSKQVSKSLNKTIKDQGLDREVSTENRDQNPANLKNPEGVKSRKLGGGAISGTKAYTFDKNGNHIGQQIVGQDANGNKYDFSYTITEDGFIDFTADGEDFLQTDFSHQTSVGSNTTAKINGNRMKKMFSTWKTGGKFRSGELAAFNKEYKNTLASALQKRANGIPKELTAKEVLCLNLYSRGFNIDELIPKDENSPATYNSAFTQREKGDKITQQNPLEIGPPYSDEYLISRGMDPKLYRQLVAEQKKEKPVSPRKKKKSPFERRERSYLNVRKKWMPTSSPMMQMEQPGMEQPGMEQPQQNQETIFDKMKMYGDGVREKVDKFVTNARYNSQVDKPIKAINNQEWVGKITEFLKQKKGELVEAKKNKDKQQEQKIFEHVNTLINDVTNYASKFESWRDRNGGDKTPGNMGGNMTSDGSMKDKRFEADLAFVGDTNTDLGITEEGKIGIKSYGLNDLKYVEDLDQGVFMKDFAGYKKFLDMSKNIQEDAESGRPKNQNIINGQADLLLKNRDSLLSWAHDPLYGQAWIQDYAQGNPDEDLSWAMPESDQFDKDRLEDEVHGWLTDKLSQAYDKYAPKKDLEDVDKIQQETMSSIGEDNYSKQTPMQYKTRAQQLIEKYS